MIDSAKLVDQQLRLVEIRRSLGQAVQKPLSGNEEEIPCGPCVLLSRQCGSAGDDVARVVGERLGWQVFNREIVEKIAERAHVRKQLVESVDEHIRSRWRRLLHPIREREGLDSGTYLDHLHEIVLSLGHHGYAVIVGRGGEFLLPARSGVRVRVIEASDVRVRRLAAMRSCSKDDASRYVHQCEAARAEFIRKAFHQDPSSLLNYDLVLNTGYLSVAAAASAVLRAVESKLGIKVEHRPCAS